MRAATAALRTLRGKSRRAVLDDLNRAISDAGAHGIDGAFAWVRVEVTCACTCACHPVRCGQSITVGATAEETDCANGCRTPLHPCEPRP